MTFISISPSVSSTVRWRVHLRSPPERVFRFLATPDGRARFWAESAEEIVQPHGTRVIRFRFASGQSVDGRVITLAEPHRFQISYFGDSTVTFDLAPDGSGGTDLTVTETGAPPAAYLQNLAGWVSLLLSLKAAVDFAVDLRNHDPSRTWDQGYVDV